MRYTARVGTIGGVPVRVHWSALITLGLVTWILGGAVLPVADPALGPPGRWSTSVVAALLFLASLLAHESAHAKVARRNDVPVGSVTLWLLGGVAELHGEPASPGAEVRIVGVGPLTSVACAAVFVGLAAVAGALDAPAVIVAALGWLALMNVALAVFNSLPAAPLDGGRLLHALLWKRTGSRSRATAMASVAGRVLGIALMGLGLAQVLLGRGIGGLWLVVVGWFLLASATAEQRVHRVLDELAGRTVQDAMRPAPLVVPAVWSVSRLGDALTGHPQHAEYIPVSDGFGRAAGLVALADLVRVPGQDRPLTSLANVAAPLERLVLTRRTEPLAQLMMRLPGRENVAPALVLDDQGGVAGTIGMRDLRRAAYRAQLGAQTATDATRN